MIHKDDRGKYIVLNKKKIYFKDGLDVLETPFKVSEKEYVGDYRAFDGVSEGKKVALAVYEK